MNICRILYAALACCALQLSGASAHPLQGYRNIQKNFSGENLIQNPSFDAPQGSPGAGAWRLNAREAQISVEGGYSQRGALIRRTDPAVYTVSFQTVSRLKPNTRYILGCRIRVRNSDGRTSAVFGVEGAVTKYQAYAGNFDWKECKTEFTSSGKENARYNIIFFYKKGRTGEASFDDFYLREAGGEYFSGILNPWNRISGTERKIHFTATAVGELQYEQSAAPEIRCLAEIRGAKGEILLSESRPLKNGRFTVDGERLPDGEYKVDVTVYDRANRVILGKTEGLRLVAGEPDRKKPKGSVSIDKYGRTLVDGKPFLPVGLYIGSVGRMYDIRAFADSPFNCVLLYSGYMGYLRGNPERGAKGVRAAMDMLDKYGLKMIFGVPFVYPGYDRGLEDQKQFWGGKGISRDEFLGNVVDAVRDHPALLAWYITDELPPQRYRELVQVRNLINRKDPHHPTCGVYFQIHELAAYSATQDVPNIDFYPIAGKKPQTQKLISESMEKARQVWSHPETGEMPLWATPQLFSWGGDNPDTNPNYRFPTENELRAMSLLSAIGGAKGFIFYYYHCILYGVGKTLDEKFIRFMPLWKTACNIAGELRELEPFLLSTAPAPKVTVRNIRGITHARAFVEETYGRIRLLVSCEGPGDAEAEITVEGIPTGTRNELRSRFGKTKRLSNAKYLFKGKDVDCDILQRWPEYEFDKEITRKGKEK